jgi:hypothetical protein
MIYYDSYLLITRMIFNDNFVTTSNMLQVGNENFPPRYLLYNRFTMKMIHRRFKWQILSAEDINESFRRPLWAWLTWAHSSRRSRRINKSEWHHMCKQSNYVDSTVRDTTDRSNLKYIENGRHRGKIRNVPLNFRLLDIAAAKSIVVQLLVPPNK